MTAAKKTTNNENPEETEKKKTVKKAAPKKATAKKAAGEKKPSAKKTTAKKPAVKKPAAKKPAAKKTTKKAEDAKEVLDTVQQEREQNAAAEQTAPVKATNTPEKAPAPVYKEEAAPVKQEQKAAVHPEAKPQPAPAVKAEAKPEYKQEFKPSEPKAEPKREFNPQPKQAQPQQQNRHEHKREEQKTAAPVQSNEKVIKILGQPTIKELAEKMDIKINEFIKKLMGMGIFATINQRLEQDMIELVVAECGFKAEITHEFAEDKIAAEDSEQEDPAHLKPRAPW